MSRNRFHCLDAHDVVLSHTTLSSRVVVANGSGGGECSRLRSLPRSVSFIHRIRRVVIDARDGIDRNETPRATMGTEGSDDFIPNGIVSSI